MVVDKVGDVDRKTALALTKSNENSHAIAEKTSTVRIYDSDPEENKKVLRKIIGGYYNNPVRIVYGDRVSTYCTHYWRNNEIFCYIIFDDKSNLINDSNRETTYVIRLYKDGTIERKIHNSQMITSVDGTLNQLSTNPIQNKVVSLALLSKADEADVEQEFKERETIAIYVPAEGQTLPRLLRDKNGLTLSYKWNSIYGHKEQSWASIRDDYDKVNKRGVVYVYHGVAYQGNSELDVQYILTQHTALTIEAIDNEVVDGWYEDRIYMRFYDSDNRLCIAKVGGKAEIEVVDMPVDDSIDALTKDVDGLKEEWESTNAAVKTLEEKKADIDGVYDEMTVGRSAELLGVAEAQEAEITFRPTDGDGSIKDGFASIERVKGETVVWNDYIDNNLTSAFKNGTSRGTLSIDGATYTVTAIAEGVIYLYYRTEPFINALIVGHKYLRICDVKTKDPSRTYVRVQDAKGDTPTKLNSEETWEKISNIFTFTERTTSTPYYQFYSDAAVVGDYISVKNCHFYDLTKMFGAGNEPTTIEEFYARIPEGVDMNAYNEGEVVGMTANGLKSVGFNAWDEEWELGRISTIDGNGIEIYDSWRSKNFTEVIPNAEYYIKGGALVRIFYYDKDFKYVDWWGCDPYKLATIPSNVRYVRLTQSGSTVYTGDICIHLVHSGYRNGEYQPYEDDVLALPTNDLFPQGMHGINGVVDEYDAEKKTQRIGVVDLGTLSWIKAWYVEGDYRVYALIPDKAKGLSNLLTSEYCQAGVHDGEMGESTITGNMYNTYVYIKDSSYATQGVDALIASLQGVMLYYELAEPVITYHDKPLHLTYKAWDFGTEAMQNDKPSTSLNAEIVYEFNARDTIRANRKQVAVLNEEMAGMTARIKALESQLQELMGVVE